MNYRSGGISALPRKTKLGGQDHLLSYITPQEAHMLREQGGGVTPTGGQYRGPGGVPAFPTHQGHLHNIAAPVPIAWTMYNTQA